MRTLIRIAAGASLIYTLYGAFLFLIQRHLLFPRHLLPVFDAALPQTVEVLDIPDVTALWLPPPGNAPAPALVFAHGNADLVDAWIDRFSVLNETGIGVLLVEYPGYGRASGTPTQETITRAFQRACDRLILRPEVDASRVVFFGQSLGGGAVCALAATRPPAALILLSTFTSVRDLAPRFLAPPFLVRDAFDNRSVVTSFPGPVLVVHGTRDRIVPYTHGKALAEAAPNGRLLTYEAGHNDCPPDWDDFWPEVEAFLRASGILSAAH